MNFNDAWERKKNETEIKNLSELAKNIGVKQPSVSARKKKGDFPIEWAYLVGEKYNLSTKWILTGQEPKRFDQIVVTRSIKNEYLIQLEEWLQKKTAEDPRQEVWFQVQLEGAFPEFKEWLRKKQEESEDYTNRKVA